MSILSEVQRIQNAKQKLRKALIRKGINIPETYLLNEYNIDIDPITKGENLTYLTKELNYLTFKWVEDGAFYWAINYTSNSEKTFTRTIEYCKNGGSWISITSGDDGYVCDTVAGDEIWVRGDNTGYTNTSYTNDYCHFGFAGKTYISGDVSSLMNWSTTLTVTHALYKLFINCKSMDIDIDKGLLLPFMTLTNNCYSSMFEGCDLLTNAPYLPALSVNWNSYSLMFLNCRSLKIVPNILPATSVYRESYRKMFSGCISLEKAPYIASNNLSFQSYLSMFEGCISLKIVPELSVESPNEYSYQNMFKDCISLEESPIIKLKTINYGCCNGMFEGCIKLKNIVIYTETINGTNIPTSSWTKNIGKHGIFIKSNQMGISETYGGTNWDYSINGIPEGWAVENLPSTEFKIEAVTNITISFTNNCEYNLGREWKQYTGGTTLNIQAGDEIYFKTNITPTSQSGIGTFSITGTFNICGDILSLINNENLSDNDYAFKNLFMGCTGLVDATDLVLPNDISEGCYLGMFKNCTGLINPPTLPATTLDQSCYKEMFYGCTSLLVAPSLPATTLTQSCYESMFYGCTSLVNAPELMATTLVQDCYKQMFYNCSSLQLITSMNDTALGTTYSNNWVYGVNSTGIFNKDYYAGWTVQYGDSYVPTGWELPIDYSTLYFTIESLADGNAIKMQRSGSPNNPTLSYSLDDGETWTTTTISGTVTFGTINTGDTIIFKGSNSNLATAWDTYNYFNGTKQFKVYGNIMSLFNGDDFKVNHEFNSGATHQCAGLFRTTYLVDASNLILPALTLYDGTYNGMFRGATNLVYGPKILPALNIPKDGYSSMFESCTSLVEAPEILATTVSGETALNRMFCMNRNNKVTAAMTKGPVLRITNPSSYKNAYQQLFCGNGNIVEITVLLSGTNKSFTSWLKNVSSTGVIKTLSGTTFASGENGLPSGWVVEDYVEE